MLSSWTKSFHISFQKLSFLKTYFIVQLSLNFSKFVIGWLILNVLNIFWGNFAYCSPDGQEITAVTIGRLPVPSAAETSDAQLLAEFASQANFMGMIKGSNDSDKNEVLRSLGIGTVQSVTLAMEQLPPFWDAWDSLLVNMYEADYISSLKQLKVLDKYFILSEPVCQAMIFHSRVRLHVSWAVLMKYYSIFEPEMPLGFRKAFLIDQVGEMVNDTNFYTLFPNMQLNAVVPVGIQVVPNPTVAQSVFESHLAFLPEVLFAVSFVVMIFIFLYFLKKNWGLFMKGYQMFSSRVKGLMNSFTGEILMILKKVFVKITKILRFSDLWRIKTFKKLIHEKVQVSLKSNSR